MTCLPASPHNATDRSQNAAKSGSLAAAELKREIEKRATPIALPPNCILFREGEPSRNIYLLQSGEISFTIRAGRRTVPCFTVESGSFIGLSGVIAGAPFALTATASPAAKIVQMNAGEFLDLIESRAEWYMCALRALAEETLQAHHALADMLAT